MVGKGKHPLPRYPKQNHLEKSPCLVFQTWLMLKISMILNVVQETTGAYFSM